MMPIPKHTGYLDFVYSFYKGLNDHEITLAYEGEINHQITKTFTNITEGKLSKEAENEGVLRKVYHVMVECLQNVSKHACVESNSITGAANHGILIVSRNEKEYRVTTGNVVKSDHVQELKHQLCEINRLTIEDLDRHYKKQLREGHLSEKGGAGLGFIDIRRKTKNELEYHFLPLEMNFAFFLLTSTIARI
jgi:hypothetical protein